MRLHFQLLSLVATIFTAPLASASSTTREPLGAVTTLENATIHTHNGRLTHVSQFDLTFHLHNELHVKLRLEPNHDIVGEGATVTYLEKDGSVKRTEGIDRTQHRVYKGTTWVKRLGHEEDVWKNVGWARITVSRDGRKPVFGGAFVVQRDHHHIQTSTNYRRTRHSLDPAVEQAHHGEEFMVVWRDSDIGRNLPFHLDLRRDVDSDASTCNSDTLGFNSQFDHPVYMAMKSKRSEQSSRYSYIFKRQQDVDTTTGGNSAGVDLRSTIGQTRGCPSTRRVALLGIATDCTYAQDFANEQAARENVLDMMNSASAVYERTFNISLGLQNLNVLPAECPGTPASGTEWNQACSSSVDISDRLNLFTAWRGQQRDSNSFWTLLSTCGTGSAVGLAWLGQLCVGTSFTTNGSVTGDGSTSGGSETVGGANVVVRTQGASEWQVMAHEVGHTFGAVHDCDSRSCGNAEFVNAQRCCPYSANACDAGGRFIMNPSTIPGIEDFSPCSIGNICSALDRNSVDGECLTNNREVTLVTGQQCGNGIVEQGEDCDCGGVEGCAGDTCCDPTTCRFTEGSVCDDANEDCCRSCQFASAETVCRASTGQCDPQETCSGTSGQCPSDATEPDGTNCGDDLQCASGQCTSRDLQCRTVMGSYTDGSNDTYACQSSGCALSCASPEFGTGVCYRLQQNFLDGTPCGGGGRCDNGRCEGSSVGGQVRSWFDDNRTVVIAVASAIGGIIFLIILSCVFSRCRRRRRRAAAPPTAPVPPPGGWQGWNGSNNNNNRPPMAQNNSNFYAARHPSQGWAQQGSYGPPTSPPPPPPAYMQHQGGSTRYA